MNLTTQQIAERVGGRLSGRGDLVIRGVDVLDAGGPDSLTFVRDGKHASAWPASRAAAALCPENLDLQPGDGRALIRVANVDLALVQVMGLFLPPRSRPAAGVHASATVAESATLAAGAAVGPGCRVGERVRIGAGTVLHGNVTLLDDVAIAEDCELFPGVVMHDRCRLGRRVILQANVVIGADGFGYAAAADGRSIVKVPHLGGVEIGDDVEIGAGSCVDRGKFADTVVGAGSKIDNLCQIAHNCRIGRHCILAGQVGLAGSVTLGDGVILGGKVAVREHVTIGSQAQVYACSAVMDDVPAGQRWGGYPARDHHEALREHAALRKLPELMKRMRQQERAT